MVWLGSADAIQRDVAQRLCAQVMTENRGKWWRGAAWRCWWCAAVSRGQPARLGYTAAPDNRGCRFVTARWEQAGRPIR